MTPRLSTNHTCRKCEGNIGEAVRQEERLRDEVETVRKFTYHADCETVNVINLRECEELLHGRRFPLKLKGAINMSFARRRRTCSSIAWPCLQWCRSTKLRRKS